MDPNVAQLLQAQNVAIDLPQLADRTLRLIADDTLRGEMGRRGRAKVDREYRFSAIVRRYDALWDDLARDAARVGLPAPAANPYDFGAARLFGHYATRPLTAGDVVVRTPASAPAPATIDAAYTEARALLDAGLLARLLAEAGAPVRVGELLAGADVPAPQAWFALLWLVKYDLLRVVAHDANEPQG